MIATAKARTVIAILGLHVLIMGTAAGLGWLFGMIV